MCIYEETYNNAIHKRDDATKEIERCTKAISYFENWNGKIFNCYDVLEKMTEHNKVIAKQCNEIILNGKHIDEGERHYPNGNGETFTTNLVIVKSALYRLKNEIDRQLNILNDSKEKSIKNRDNAIATLRNTPVPPCGSCLECYRSAPVATTVREPVTTTVNKSATSKVNKPAGSKVNKPAASTVNKSTSSKVNKPVASTVNEPVGSAVKKSKINNTEKTPKTRTTGKKMPFNRVYETHL